MSAIAKYAPPALTNLPLVYQGKSRDTFQAKWPDPNDKRRLPLLIVATNRISTHNIVHKSTIGKKGEVLTALTIFWPIDVLEKTGVAHHLVASGKKIYDYLPGSPSDYPKDLHLRAIVVKHLDIILIEFIYRAYLCGSLWDRYYSKGLPDPYGLELDSGLPLMHPFSYPISTPTEKSDTDPPLDSEYVIDTFPSADRISRRAFKLGRDYLRPKGIECLDSKFELGIDEDGQVILADEVLTPDSSRFARLADIKEGENPPWLDKQIARDKAEAMWLERGQKGEGRKPLEFPPIVCSKLYQNYTDLFQMVTGTTLREFQRERLS